MLYKKKVSETFFTPMITKLSKRSLLFIIHTVNTAIRDEVGSFRSRTTQRKNLL
jgi:hypothetical protein